MDYKSTLNLPKTKFPMKANLVKNEPELLKKRVDAYLGSDAGKDTERKLFQFGKSLHYIKERRYT